MDTSRNSAPSPPPAHDTVCGWLRETVARYAEAGENRLPTLDVLSYRAGVGYRAMRKAVQTLVGEGLLTARQGSGIYLAEPTGRGGDGGRVATPAVSSRWQKLASRIREDIRQGLPGMVDRLPPVKTLTARYGVSHHTLRDALHDLDRQGLLERVGRGYRVASLATTGSARNTVVLVTRGEPSGRLTLSTRRTQHYLRLLEQECALSGLRLRIALLPANTTDAVMRLRQQGVGPSGADADRLLGTVVWPLGLQGGLQTILEYLCDGGTPTAVLDEGGGLPVDPGASMRRLVRVFQIAHDPRDGLAVGTFLTHRGHRHVAFVSTHRGIEWADQRYAGLRQAFEPESDVVRVDADASPEAEDFVNQGRQLANRTQQLLTTDISRAIAQLDPIANTVDAMRARLDKQPQLRCYREEHIVPMLRRLHAEPDITAWVAANDELAVECLLYCRDNGIRVPEDISLVGFNDELEAFNYGITSYNFNPSAVMRAMVRYVTGSRTANRPGAGDGTAYGLTAEYLPGFVSDRGTVADVRQPGKT